MAEDTGSSALVGSKIRELRKAHGLTLEELAARTNTDTGNLSRIERGQQRFTPEFLDAASAALEVPVQLFFVQEPASDYSVEGPVAVPARPIPVVGTAQLGDDGFWDELQYPVGHGDGFVRYPTKDPNCYAVRVKGDSMRPRIRPGEFVIVEPNAAVVPGDEVLVTTKDGRSMVKLLHTRRNGMLELYSVNDDHRPITLDEADVKSIHSVGGIVKSSLYYRDL